MDARERLRQYLEQRRELGESELVLDRMDVDDVLRVVGALRGGAAPVAPATPATPTASPADEAGPRAAAPAAPSEPPADAGRDEPGASPADAGRGEMGDWRAALRAAGGAPDQLTRGRGTGGAGTPPDPEREAEMARKAAQTDPGGPRGDKGTEPPKRTATGPVTERGAGSGKATGEGAARLPKWLVALDVPAGLAVGGGPAELLEPEFAKLKTLEAVARTIEKCTRCPLYATATHAVPGEGNPDADVVCVGEAPGQSEDETGRPFVGASGQLLTKILAAIKLTREEVFIANVLKHRPPGNRNPAPDEVVACSPYLLRQLELVKPKVIVTFGTFAAQTLLETKTPIGKLRGQVHLYHGTPLVVTYHPAALLRNPAWKRPTWEDVKLARRILDHAAGA
jgi:DNA polymerase